MRRSTETDEYDTTSYSLRNRQRLQTAWTEEAHNITLTRKRAPSPVPTVTAETSTSSTHTTTAAIESDDTDSASNNVSNDVSTSLYDVQYFAKVAGAVFTSLMACVLLLLLATRHTANTMPTTFLPAASWSRLPDLQHLLNRAEEARRVSGGIQQSKDRVFNDLQSTRDLLVGLSSEQVALQKQWHDESSALMQALDESRSASGAVLHTEQYELEVTMLQKDVSVLTEEVSIIHDTISGLQQTMRQNYSASGDSEMIDGVVGANSEDIVASAVTVLRDASVPLIDAGISAAASTLMEDMVIDAIPDALQQVYRSIGARNDGEVWRTVHDEVARMNNEQHTKTSAELSATASSPKLIDAAAAARGGRILLIPSPYKDLLPPEKRVYSVSEEYFTSPPYYPSTVARLMGTLLGTAPSPLYSIDPHIIISHHRAAIGGYAMRGSRGNITIVLSETAQVKRVDFMQPFAALPSLHAAEPLRVKLLGWRQLNEELYFPSAFSGMSDSDVAVVLSDATIGEWITLANLDIVEDCSTSIEDTYISCAIKTEAALYSVSTVMLIVEANRGNNDFSLLYRVRIMA